MSAGKNGQKKAAQYRGPSQRGLRAGTTSCQKLKGFISGNYSSERRASRGCRLPAGGSAESPETRPASETRIPDPAAGIRYVRTVAWCTNRTSFAGLTSLGSSHSSKTFADFLSMMVGTGRHGRKEASCDALLIFFINTKMMTGRHRKKAVGKLRCSLRVD